MAAWNYMGQYGWWAKSFFPPLFTMCRAFIPARVCLPLGDPSKVPKDLGRGIPTEDQKALVTNSFPLIVFCHGLAGNRLAYSYVPCLSSEFCGNLASQGFIVAAIEHRDGSGLGSHVWSGVDSLLQSNGHTSEKQRRRLRRAFYRGTSESIVNLANELNNEDKDEQECAHLDPLREYSKVPYLPFEVLGLAPFMEKQGKKETALRRAQLAMRMAEIEEALYVLKRINAGDSEWLASVHMRSLGSALCGARRFRRSRKHLGIPHCAEFFSTWKNKVDVGFPSLCGHSFGGATLFEYLRTEQNNFQYGIILDPWMEFVRDPQTDTNVRLRLKKPVYVINSEGFTMWREQYNKLVRVLVDGLFSNEARRGWLMTLCGSNHGDFSDLPYLLPHIFGSPVQGPACMHSFIVIVLEQIRLLREQKHLLNVEDTDAPHDLGKHDHKIGGLHINSNPNCPRPSDNLLYRFQSKVLRIRMKRKQTRSLFWELRGWRKQAEQDPSTRAYRKHQRMVAREIRHEARLERTRQLARRNSAATTDGMQPEVQNVSEIQRRLWDAESNDEANEEADAEQEPSFVDPLMDRRSDSEDVWEGSVLDTDARRAYEVWERNVTAAGEEHKRPFSLLTLALWYLGIKEGLAPPGHLLVHTM